MRLQTLPNEIIEARFDGFRLMDGQVKILMSNGEFYEGNFFEPTSAPAAPTYDSTQSTGGPVCEGGEAGWRAWAGGGRA